ncbi:Glutathione S-transferase [Rhynchospora pubera]|uniref:glutathione transferase n=1 Tax=Rhynchospora pubera TaxID=906938 RepID=A0AAV8EYZ6_9POAL|nr:Glutathione S-transferase [Rhynchospora pubera]KAJ4784701.1 Glutathione S-transferase [Rhynchospora pubera]
MASVKIFGSPTSAEVARVLTCLFEKDVEFQLIRVDTYRGPQRMPEYLKLQPRGEALTFEDGKLTLVESRKICRHIAENYPEQGYKDLLGAGALERATIEQWLQTEEHSFDPPCSDLVFSLAFNPKLDEEWVKNNNSKKELDKVLDIYEQRLKETRYLAGDKFTLADLSHLPNTQRLASDKRCKALFEKRSNVNRWWGEISRRASWQKVVAMQQEPPPMV